MVAGNKQIQIQAYSIRHITRPINYVPLLAEIILTAAGGSVLGVVCFYPEGKVPPSTIPASGQPYLNFDIARLNEIIATLRYEKPIYLTAIWDANNYITHAEIGTSVEPVGEQEGV